NVKNVAHDLVGVSDHRFGGKQTELSKDRIQSHELGWIDRVVCYAFRDQPGRLVDKVAIQMFAAAHRADKPLRPLLSPKAEPCRGERRYRADCGARESCDR